MPIKSTVNGYTRILVTVPPTDTCTVHTRTSYMYKYNRTVLFVLPYIILCVLYISCIQITRLCEIRRGKTPGENGVPLCFYDMSGHPVYSELFPLLADQRAFFLVVFRASDNVAFILNAFSRYSVQVL